MLGLKLLGTKAPVRDPNFANVSLLLHGDGTNGSTTFVDNSLQNFTVTANGNSQVSTSIKKYGTGSIYLDGSGDFLSLPSSSSLDITGGNFTIEAWIYKINNSGNQQIVAQDDGISSGQTFQFRTDGTSGVLRFIYWTSSARSSFVQFASTGSIPLTTWTHVAVTFNGSTVRLFVNGTQDGSSTVSSLYSAQVSTGIGNYRNASLSNYFNGYIDDFRITKGVARYTSNFTPSTVAFPNG